MTDFGLGILFACCLMLIMASVAKLRRPKPGPAIPRPRSIFNANDARRVNGPPLAPHEELIVKRSLPLINLAHKLDLDISLDQEGFRQPWYDMPGETTCNYRHSFIVRTSFDRWKPHLRPIKN